MGSPVEVSQWNLSASEPSTAQPQVCNYQHLQAYKTFLLRDMASSHATTIYWYFHIN